MLIGKKIMARKPARHFAAKHPPGTTCDPEIAEAIKQKTTDGRITCADAHHIASQLNVSPAEVGVCIDLLENRLSQCQLGLFGYRPHKKLIKPVEDVPPELAQTIAELQAGNRISCMSCWDIAKRYGCSKVKVASVCETLNLKISSCQLGTF